MIPYRLQYHATRLRRATTALRGMAHLDRCDLKDTVLLAGVGRSGTTWMGQVINHDHAYREVFEPLNPTHIKSLNGHTRYRYLRPASRDDADQDDGKLIAELLAGRVRCAWTDRRNRKHLVCRRLVKAIRASLLLGWLNKKHPQMKLLYALRHPCAVIYSRIKLGWDTHLDDLLAQPALMRDHLEPCREALEKARRSGDPWQQHAALWCALNRVPLRQLQPGQMHILFYERFCTGFDIETQALFAYLGQPIREGIDQARRQTSAHYRRDSAVVHGKSLIADWQRHVTPRQIDQTLAMLQAFGLDHLYDADPLPRCTRDHAFIDHNASPAPVAAPSPRDAA